MNLDDCITFNINHVNSICGHESASIYNWDWQDGRCSGRWIHRILQLESQTQTLRHNIKRTYIKLSA
jgi:hypothetical protein